MQKIRFCLSLIVWVSIFLMYFCTYLNFLLRCEPCIYIATQNYNNIDYEDAQIVVLVHSIS